MGVVQFVENSVDQFPRLAILNSVGDSCCTHILSTRFLRHLMVPVKTQGWWWDVKWIYLSVQVGFLYSTFWKSLNARWAMLYHAHTGDPPQLSFQSLYLLTYTHCQTSQVSRDTWDPPQLSFQSHLHSLLDIPRTLGTSQLTLFNQHN